MTLWLISPRDPLIFRDGRPFTADPGARATTMPFPFPSTLAGAARTLSVPAPQPRRFDNVLVAELREKSIRGPLLVEMRRNGGIARWFAPAPADALILRTEETVKRGGVRQWLRPLALPAGAQTNLGEGLHLAGARCFRKEKPHPDVPAFWNWEAFETWLTIPADEKEIEDLVTLGIRGLPREYRTHVRIAPRTKTADPGGLFQTSGLEFTWAGNGEDRLPLSQTRELGLALDTDAEIAAEWGFLGGERRVARWQRCTEKLPSCPDVIENHIEAAKHCRLVLLTPALFKQGDMPEWVLNLKGVRAKVISAVVPRYQAVSGWDYKVRKPKATRRLAPAGSVYYLNLEGSPDQITAFVHAVWMHNVSDNEQDRRDGFGLAVLGTWDGTVVEMEVSDA